MKLQDILLESPTDIVARFYKDADSKIDQKLNPENVKYKEQNAEYYDKYFKEWFNEEVTPVFTKPTETPAAPYTNKPKGSTPQSPGYRGLHYALQAAGLPFNRKVQEYKPDPGRILAAQINPGELN